MQTNLSIGNTIISGTLNNISDGSVWDSGTWGAEESTGHFIFVKATGIPEGATATIEVVNGFSGPVTLDSDLNAVLRIVNKETQKLRLTVTIDGETKTKTYSLSGVTLA